MVRDEGDRAKRAKLDALQLSRSEWNRIHLFLSLLKVSRFISLPLLYQNIFTVSCQHANAAQQAFSSDNGPSLHLALPALEALHKAWTS
jgi:hypothetical protein